MKTTIGALIAATLLSATATPASFASPAMRPAHAGMSTAPSRPDTAVTTKFDVDGVTVILRRNTANEVIAANLYLLGGARQLTPTNAGIEALLLLASERGTRKFPGATGVDSEIAIVPKPE